MALTDIKSEDRLVQQTFADHLHEVLGWDSVYAWNQETFGPDGTLGRRDQKEVAPTRDLRAAIIRLTPELLIDARVSDEPRAEYLRYPERRHQERADREGIAASSRPRRSPRPGRVARLPPPEIVLMGIVPERIKMEINLSDCLQGRLPDRIATACEILAGSVIDARAKPGYSG